MAHGGWGQRLPWEGMKRDSRQGRVNKETVNTYSKTSRWPKWALWEARLECRCQVSGTMWRKGTQTAEIWWTGVGENEAESARHWQCLSSVIQKLTTNPRDTGGPNGGAHSAPRARLILQACWDCREVLPKLIALHTCTAMSLPRSCLPRVSTSRKVVGRLGVVRCSQN